MASADEVYGHVFVELLDNFLDDRVYSGIKEVETAILALRDLLIERGLTTAQAFDLAIDARYQQICQEGLRLGGERTLALARALGEPGANQARLEQLQAKTDRMLRAMRAHERDVKNAIARFEAEG